MHLELLCHRHSSTHSPTSVHRQCYVTSVTHLEDSSLPQPGTHYHVKCNFKNIPHLFFSVHPNQLLFSVLNNLTNCSSYCNVCFNATISMISESPPRWIHINVHFHQRHLITVLTYMRIHNRTSSYDSNRYV